jgi:hypothetical protein
MVRRRHWLQAIHDAWSRRSVVWLMGVRRAGKTVLAQSLPGCRYYDCELPSVRRLLEDPEDFWSEHRAATVVLDEIHRLPNPSEVLKIAADHYHDVRVLATGSSTLGASARFRDTLAGRKAEIWLTPMDSLDLLDFGGNLRRRLLHGGLPFFYLAKAVPVADFQEWMDAYWAKDIQELFRLERRRSFQQFVELLFSQSGGIFEANRFAGPCEVSRTTIANYLAVLEATLVMHVIRPFATRRAAEIVTAPKVYGFDTGFVCFYRGWESLRRDDLGLLWEHWVLNEIHSRLPGTLVRYWRDKQKHEIDFVWTPPGRTDPVAIECKWSPEHLDLRNLAVFRRHYPRGENFVVCQDVRQAFTRKYGELRVRFVSLETLIRSLQARRTSAPIAS